MLYETVIVGLLFNDFGNPIKYLGHYAVAILLFYLHADKALPFATANKKHFFWRLPLVLVIEISMYVVAQFLVSKLMIWIGVAKTDVVFNFELIARNLYRAILLIGYGTGYYFLQTYLAERRKTEELEKDRLKAIIEQQKITQELVHAQNAFLKAQINPHFLFNTLDFIYHNVSEKSPIAGEAIIRLSHMMRFAIDADRLDKNYLADEIEQVENLLYLYQIRKTEKLNLDFSYTEVVTQLQLIPLVLLTLVENIFKHADLSDADDRAVIKLYIKADVFYLETSNLINPRKSNLSNNSGLNNIENRLIYAYGTEINFSYAAIDHHFTAKLSIPVSLLKVLS